MPHKTNKGATGVMGAGRELEAEEQSRKDQRGQAPGKKKARTRNQPVYRGKDRGDGQPLKTVSITLPADVIESADMFVLRRKQSASGYNRSALVEEALREFLKPQ